MAQKINKFVECVNVAMMCEMNGCGKSLYDSKNYDDFKKNPAPWS
jgi:hypothetical protein